MAPTLHIGMVACSAEGAALCYRTICAEGAALRSLRDRQCEAVVLGCTEIPLIIGDGNSPIPTLDSTRLLARAALRSAVARDSADTT